MKGILLLLLLMTTVSFGFLTLDHFEDYYFPKASVDIITDFEINSDGVFLIENEKTQCLFNMSSTSFDWTDSLEFVFLIDTSYFNMDYSEKIISELKTFYKEFVKNEYDVSMRIITSSQYINERYFNSYGKLFFWDEESLEKMFEKMFDYRGISGGQFDLYMTYMNQFKPVQNKKRVFVIVPGENSVGVDEFQNVQRYIKAFNDLNSYVFVFERGNNYYSEVLFEELVGGTGGQIFNMETTPLVNLLSFFYEQKFYRTIINYESNEKIVDQNYGLKIYLHDRKEEYELSAVSDFHKDLKITSLTASPFILKPGEIARVECLTSIDGLVDFSWVVDSGLISHDQNINNIIFWQAPKAIGTYRIEVRCYDGKKECTSSVYILVE